MWEEKVKGAVLGLVAGDALGVPVEFMTREKLRQDPVTGMRSGGAHGQSAGTWSDDSSMVLCLLESLTGGLDYEDMMARFLRWADEGYMTAHGKVFDMGVATRKALMKFVHGTPALKCGGQGTYDNGNGSLMRILPVALYLHRTMGPDFPDEPGSYRIIHNASALTHAHPISLIGCGIYCAVANELLCGEGVLEAIQRGIARARAVYVGMSECKPYFKEYRRVDAEVLLALPQSEISGSGYVVHTLEAALWCLLHTDSCRSCLLEAVNLGEDTDTVGAVAGGLAGIRYGLADVPKQWLSALAKRKEIEALCERFAANIL